MEKHLKKIPDRLRLILFGFITVSTLLVSCQDDYIYDNKEPDWLGASIYDALKEDGHYKYLTQIIEETNLKDVLAKTGSKTLFVANDEAFERFFKSKNPWGVKSFDEMTIAQKRILINFSMINNSYLIETLSNYYSGSLQEGKALRRVSAVNVLDSIPFEMGSQLPYGTLWDKYRTSGIHILKDHTEWPMVHFLKKQMKFNNITDEDFKIMTGIERTGDDAFIFDNKVIARDITCKNGYVNQLENVLVPPVNMAQYIRTAPQLSTFSRLLDRFCAPYYSSSLTTEYNKLEDRTKIDSIYVLRYFAKSDNGGVQNLPPPTQTVIPAENLLPYNPGWNSYAGQGAPLQSDMAVIFAPTNEALQEYMSFSNSGSGRALKERYGNWENVPTDILQLLIARHMRPSLLNSLPSVFDKMVDAQSSRIKAKKTDIVDSLNYVGINGLVYATNTIYPPDDYVSVYGPVLFSKKTEILRWGIRSYLYKLYLNSMVNNYGFIAPTDKALQSYVDPFMWGTNMPTTIRFWYDSQAKSVKASVFKYDETKEGFRGDSVALITNADFIRSRLVKILDQSIVVNDFKDTASNQFEDGYYITKDGNFLKVQNTNDIPNNTSSTQFHIQGGGNINDNTYVSLADSGLYHQDNGTTYFVNELPKTPFRSVYNILKNDTSFSEFFNICAEFPNNNVFVRKANYYGIDYNIKFFNTFRYTVYVPTNQAIEDAYNNGTLTRWSVINAETNKTKKDSMINAMERFVRYHFQDNAVFIHPNQPVSALYQSATIKNDTKSTYWDTFKNKFYRIGVKTSGNSLKLTTEKYSVENGEFIPETAEVVTSNGRYNITARDYVFSIDPKLITSLNAANYTSSQITTSSTAVIHQINKVLRFQ